MDKSCHDLRILSLNEIQQVFWHNSKLRISIKMRYKQNICKQDTFYIFIHTCTCWNEENLSDIPIRTYVATVSHEMLCRKTAPICEKYMTSFCDLPFNCDENCAKEKRVTFKCSRVTKQLPHSHDSCRSLCPGKNFHEANQISSTILFHKAFFVITLLRD